MVVLAIGIIGATVMPHNLYLHSSIVQTRKYEQNAGGKREAIKFATIDSTVALMFALFINAAILVLAAAAFGLTEVDVPPGAAVGEKIAALFPGATDAFLSIGSQMMKAADRFMSNGPKGAADEVKSQSKKGRLHR